ncbi:MAG TPA: chemotaxis protein CheW [Myxococcota bacterium]|jgi:purine-binding chemotaxis protein CheW
MDTETPMQTSDPSCTTSQYLSFRACGEVFAIAVLRVREIIEYRPVTRVPGTVGWIRGVINLRGKVIPIVDLALRFGLAESEVGKRTCIVIVDAVTDASDLVVGVIADSVSEVIELEPAAISQPPTFGTPISAEVLCGLGRLGSGFALVLDVDRVFACGELGSQPLGVPRAAGHA